jgi:hypothetical protein
VPIVRQGQETTVSSLAGEIELHRPRHREAAVFEREEISNVRPWESGHVSKDVGAEVHRSDLSKSIRPNQRKFDLVGAAELWIAGPLRYGQPTEHLQAGQRMNDERAAEGVGRVKDCQLPARVIRHVALDCVSLTGLITDNCQFACGHREDGRMARVEHERELLAIWQPTRIGTSDKLPRVRARRIG